MSPWLCTIELSFRTHSLRRFMSGLPLFVFTQRDEPSYLIRTKCEIWKNIQFHAPSLPDSTCCSSLCTRRHVVSRDLCLNPYFPTVRLEYAGRLAMRTKECLHDKFFGNISCQIFRLFPSSHREPLSNLVLREVHANVHEVRSSVSINTVACSMYPSLPTCRFTLHTRTQVLSLFLSKSSAVCNRYSTSSCGTKIRDSELISKC